MLRMQAALLAPDSCPLRHAAARDLAPLLVALHTDQPLSGRAVLLPPAAVASRTFSPRVTTQSIHTQVSLIISRHAFYLLVRFFIKILGLAAWFASNE